MTARLLFSLAAALLASHAAYGCSVTEPENFPPFFDRFAHEKSFAASRTIYPAERVRYEYAMENGKQQITEWRRSVNRQQDAGSATFAEYVRMNALTYTLQHAAPARTRVEVRKPDAAWFMTYDFLLKGGCWYLGEIQFHAIPGM